MCNTAIKHKRRSNNKKNENNFKRLKKFYLNQVRVNPQIVNVNKTDGNAHRATSSNCH